MPQFKRVFPYIAAACLALFFVIATVLLWGNFSGSYDSMIGFTPSNFSNSITAEQPAQIDFLVSKDKPDHCYLRFTPNGEAAQATVLHVTVVSENDEVLLETDIAGDALYQGQYINFVFRGSVPKNTRCRMLIESDAADEASAYRMLLGPSLSSDIQTWYCGAYEETGPDRPELHVVYLEHFGARTFALYSFCLIAGLLALLLPASRWQQKVRAPFGFLILVFSAPVLVCFVEMLAMNTVLYITPRLLVCNVLLLLGAQLLVLAVTGRTFAGTAAGVLVAAVAGIASHYVMLYRGTAINPADLFAITAAADVVSHYTFDVDMSLMLALSVFFAGCCFAFRYRAAFSLRAVKGRLLRGGALLAGAAMLAFCCSPLSLRWSGAVLNLKYNTESAQRNGLLYNFVQCLPSLNIQKPDGYSTEQAAEAAQRYIPAGEEPEADNQPDIILVMSETWADYSAFADLSHLSEDPLAYFHSVAQDDDPRTLTGTTVVPVYGSGTCNSEFEAVTGFSMRNFDSSCFPYLQYVVQGTPSLASWLKELGYTTTALHPGIADTWHRDSVYPALGFDTALFDVDFPHQDMMHELISDGACFDTILDMLPADEEAPPAFILNVTIQNHGGYRSHTDFDLSIRADSEDSIFDEMEVYSSLLYYSDQEMQRFIEQLEQRQRPTILLIFGDHQPALNSEYLDFIHYGSTVSADPLLQYTTPYLIWANYEIDTGSIPQTLSANYLPAALLHLAGLPANGWFRMLWEQMQTAPVYSLAGVYDASGTALDASAETFGLYRWFQYGGMREPDRYPAGFFG